MMRLRRHVTIKSIFGIVLLLVLFSLIVSTIGYNSFTEALLQQYAEGAFLTARTAAELVDADRMDEYAQSGGTTAAYLEVLDRQSARLKKLTPATYVGLAAKLAKLG